MVNKMERIGVILLLGVTLVSLVLGAVTAELDQQVLPQRPIVVQMGHESDPTTPRVEAVRITMLKTVTMALFPKPQVDSSHTEFRGGDVMGVVLGFSVTWDQRASLFPMGSFSTKGDHQLVYFGDALSAHIISSLMIEGADGDLVADGDDFQLWGGSSSYNSGRGTIQRRYAIKIPYSWKPAAYILKAYVEDHMTMLSDSKEVSVNILVGPAPEQPHPSPISTQAEDLVLDLEDLSEEWEVVWETGNQTILEGCVSSFGRMFRRTVGSFTENFDIRVLQFESVSVANESFNGKLEGAFISGKKHGEVMMLDIGNRGFLRDRSDRREPGFQSPTGWSTGSSVTFITENVVVTISASYNDQAMEEGIYVTNQQLIELARIQEAKIST